MSKKDKMYLYPKIIKDKVSLGVTREEWDSLQESKQRSLIENGLLDTISVSVDSEK